MRLISNITLASALFAGTARANNVCGPIPAGTIWSSDVTVTCDLDIADLTIGPGVHVYLAGNYRIVVSGRIQVLGTPSSPVVFKPSPGSTAGWGGVRFTDTIPGSEFHWTIIEGAMDSGVVVVRSTPTFTGVTFRNNRASYGGGLRAELLADDLVLVNCAFEENYADVSGGAIHVSGSTQSDAGTLVVSSSSFSRNNAGTTGTNHNTSGGAIHADAKVVVDQAAFSDNEARSYTIYAAGGRYSRGGGVFVAGGRTEIAGSTFLRNGVRMGAHPQTPDASRAHGGAICIVAGELQLSRTLIAKSLLYVTRNPDQRGSGLYVGGGTASLTHVTIANGSHHGLYANAGTTSVVNSILWGSNNGGQQVSDASGTVTASYSNVQMGWTGPNNTAYNPVFLDVLHDNYHLSSASPCIDAGDPNSPPDFDGSRADMGAFQTSDCNGNGLLDADDIMAGSSSDVNLNNLPDECECFAFRYCQAGSHSAGNGATMGVVGVPSVSHNNLALIAEGCPPNKPGIFYYGAQQANNPFGDGSRCVGGATFRLYSFVFTGSTGVATRRLDLTYPPQPAGQITPYSRWNFQFWFRDPTGPGGSGFNLSDGLEVVFCP